MADRIEVMLAEINGRLRALRDNDIDQARRIAAIQAGLNRLAEYIAQALERIDKLEKRIGKEPDHPQGSA